MTAGCIKFVTDFVILSRIDELKEFVCCGEIVGKFEKIKYIEGQKLK